jgi:hypothetical protein
METQMFPRPEIAAQLGRFIPVELYTDGVDAASASNKKLQEEKFGQVALPFYVVLGPDGRKLGEFPGLTRDAGQFLGFLQQSQSVAQHLARRD